MAPMNLRMCFPEGTNTVFSADPEEFYETFLWNEQNVQVYVIEDDGTEETYLTDWIAKKQAGKVIRLKDVQPCYLYENFSWLGHFKANVILGDGRRVDLEDWVDDCQSDRGCDCTEQDTFDVELILQDPTKKAAEPPSEIAIAFAQPEWQDILQRNFTDPEITAITSGNVASLRPKGGYGRHYSDDCNCWSCDSPRRALKELIAADPVLPPAPKTFASLPRGTKLRAYIDGSLVGKARKQDDRVFLYERNKTLFGSAGRYMSFSNFQNNFGVSASKVSVRTEEGLEVTAH